MKLYTAGGSKANRMACKELGVGLMMCDGWRDPSDYPFFAVDNGAYSAWSQGKRWDPATFMHILARCAEEGLEPDFAVLPDIVGGGIDSLNLSLAWRETLDVTWPDAGFRWALAVQDGMDQATVHSYAVPYGVSTIFVGGTLEWKLATMRQWAEFAHKYGMDCHVGRIGPVDRMVEADLAGADSIDSTTWVQRNGCLRHHVKAYRSFMATRKPLEDFA